MTEFKIAQLTDFENVKELMLTALKTDPYAFSVDLMEYLIKDEDWWRNYLSIYINSDRGLLILLKDKGKIIGITGVIFDKSNRRNHVASIVWVYVVDKHRNIGNARKLVEESFRQVQQHSEVKKISLYVNSTQENAIRLYNSLGFSQSGRLKNELKIEGKFIDVLILERFL